MGRQSREKRERRERGEIRPKERQEIRPVFICRGVILFGTFLILFTPLIGPPLTNSFFFPFVGPKSLYFMGLTELIFFTWLFLTLIDKRFRPRFNLILLGLVLFLTVLVASALAGVDPSYSFWSKFERMTGILMFLHLLAFFLVISSTFDKKDWEKIIAVSIFVGVIIGTLSLFFKNPLTRGGATIGNESFLGTYLLFNLFFALYLFFKSTPLETHSGSEIQPQLRKMFLTGSKEGLKVYSATSFIIIFLSLLLSGARAAKFSFLGGLILLFFLWLAFSQTPLEIRFLTGQRRKIKAIGVSLLLLSLISVFVFSFLAFQPESFVRKGIVERFVGETFGGRFVVWEKGWENFLEKPVLGWGPENFEFAFTKNYNPCLGTEKCGIDVWYDRAHNITFDTIVTSGILGMLSYILIFLFTFYFLWRNYLRKKIDPVRNILSGSLRVDENINLVRNKVSNGVDFCLAGIFSALLISYSVQNLTVFDMVSSYMIFFLTLGFIATPHTYAIGVGVKKEISENELKSVNSRYSFPIFILILFLFLISFTKFVILPLQADAYTISAMKSQPFSEERLSFYKKTLSASPVGKYQIREFFVDSSLGSLSEDIPKENLIREFDFLVQELEKSIKENAINYRAYLKLGQLLNVYARIEPSKIEEAEKILNKAIEISPNNQQGYWSLAQTKIQQGNIKEAFLLAEKAVELEPNLERSHIIVIRIAQWLGDSELVEKKIKEALEINPNWEKELKEILEKP